MLSEVLGRGARLFNVLKSYDNDTKIAPLTKGFFLVSKTGKSSRCSTTSTRSRPRSLEEDYDIKLPDPAELDRAGAAHGLTSWRSRRSTEDPAGTGRGDPGRLRVIRMWKGRDVWAGDRQPRSTFPMSITDPDELHAAVDDLTRRVRVRHRHRDDHQATANPRTNSMLGSAWVGRGRVYLIPMRPPQGHPLLRRSTRSKRPVHDIYPPGHPRGADASWASRATPMHEHHRAAGLRPRRPCSCTRPTSLDAIKPLLFSDRAKIGHNVKFDMQSIGKYYGDLPARSVPRHDPDPPHSWTRSLTPTT